MSPSSGSKAVRYNKRSGTGVSRTQVLPAGWGGSEKTPQRMSIFHSGQREECDPQQDSAQAPRTLLLVCVGGWGGGTGTETSWDPMVKGLGKLHGGILLLSDREP